MDDLRRLAFQIAESNGIYHAFSKTDVMAGKKWHYGFMLCPPLPLPLPMLPRMPTRHGCNQRKELNLKHVIDLSPLPVTKAMVRKRKVTPSHACELTCSPYKNNLVDKTMMSQKSKPDRRKKLAKQSKVGLEKAMPTRQVPTEEPSTSKTTATQSRAHYSSDPPKPSRLQLIEDIEDCRTGQSRTILYDGKIYPGIMRRVMDLMKNTCGGAVHANCGTEQVPMASEG